MTVSNEQLNRILAQHQSWLEAPDPEGASPASFAKADLSHTDLSGRMLQRATFVEAKLEGAILRGAQLQEADLRSANLRAAVLQGAKLQNALLLDADLQSADLRDAALNAAQLQGADLRGANLSRADLSGADLSRTILHDADLQDADLRGVKGLLGRQLSGANVSGTILPEPLARFEGLARVADSAGNAGKLFVSMLSGCAYAWVTIATTTDVRLLTNSVASPLPVLGADIPIVGFYAAAPILLLALFLYFNLHMQRHWQALAALPAVFPDGRRQANLARAMLQAVFLQQAHLLAPTLEGADLRIAQLQRTNLQLAQLENANLGDANIEQADLRGADLRGALCLAREQIESAIISSETRLPDYPEGGHVSRCPAETFPVEVVEELRQLQRPGKP